RLLVAAPGHPQARVQGGRRRRAAARALRPRAAAGRGDPRTRARQRRGATADAPVPRRARRPRAHGRVVCAAPARRGGAGRRGPERRRLGAAVARRTHRRGHPCAGGAAARAAQGAGTDGRDARDDGRQHGVVADSAGGRALSLGRHARHYLLIGGIQWLVDWGVMVLLSHYGMRVEPANICGRVAGALLGYWLNGKLTFAGDDTAIGRTQLARFVAMW